jgi:glycosyltransferase involved in cell wall biosynthesis
MFHPLNKKETKGLRQWDDKIIRVPRFVSEEERKLYFTACDAVILPYRKGFYMICGGLLDAVNYGKAIVAADQYQMGYLVNHYGLGITFPPEDIAGMRDALQQFADKPDEWYTRIEGNCRKLAMEYSWENMSAMYRRTFEKIIMDSGPEKDKVIANSRTAE